MKTKTRLAEEQLEKVANLRGRGWSWAAIGREIGINRQVIKREYTNWEEGQAEANLQVVQEEPIQAARQEALVEEFHTHLESLSTLAQELSDQLDKALTSRQSTPYQDVFAAVLEVDRPLSYSGEESHGSKLRQVWRRRRRWLYQSLLTHLSVTSWSENLDEWKEYYPGRDAALRELEEQVLSRFRMHLDSQFIDIDWDEQTVQHLGGEVAAVTWAVATEAQELNKDEDELEDKWMEIVPSVWQVDKYIQVSQREQGWTLRILGKDASSLCPEEEQAQRLKKICEQIVEDLLCHGEARESALVSRKLVLCTEELLKQLDSLQLRPVLLRTKCDLCPA